MSLQALFATADDIWERINFAGRLTVNETKKWSVHDRGLISDMLVGHIVILKLVLLKELMQASLLCA